MMTSEPSVNQPNSAKPLISSLGYLGLLPFFVLMLFNFVPSANVIYQDADGSVTLNAFRMFSAVMVSFIAGSLWAFGSAQSLGFQLINSKVNLISNGLIWGSVLVILAAWGVLFLVPKAGLFVAALLFLVIWQIEQKTQLTKVYPIWYSELRVKLTMVVVVCHMSIWMTLGENI